MAPGGWRTRTRRSARDPGSFLLTLEAVDACLLAVELLAGWLAPTAFLFWADLPLPVLIVGSFASFVGTLTLARVIQRWRAARRWRPIAPARRGETNPGR